MAQLLVRESGNTKLARSRAARHAVSATYAPRRTCPQACPVRSVCYAQTGMNTRGVWDGVSRPAGHASRAEMARAEARAILANWPRDGRPLRLHVTGDASTPEAASILARAVARAQAEGAGPAWTYSHAWRDVPRNAWGPISVLASTERAAHLETARARGYASALIADPGAPMPEGWRAIPCPAQQIDGVVCRDCMLCTRADRLRQSRRVITFAPHGSGARKLRAMLAN